MGKTRVGIIFGGKSAEHEVSLQSARNIVAALDTQRFEAVLIGVDKDGRWFQCDPSNWLANADDPNAIALVTNGPQLSMVPGASGPARLQAIDGSSVPAIDVVFPIIHGTGGEDGALQGLLRLLELPFVGSDVIGSAACMDKDVAKRLLRDAGLNVAPFVCFNATSAKAADFDAIVAELGLPLFVKPANQGSSVGVSKVRDRAQFDAAMALALSFDRKVLVESAIVGREVECAVLGNDEPRASLCGEIVLNDEFYAYDTKYLSASGADIVIPAQIGDDTHARIADVAIAAYKALECAGLSRVDVFLTEDGQIVINEINTLPGFTAISMYPKMWGASGIAYTDLISQLIDLALARHAAWKALRLTM